MHRWSSLDEPRLRRLAAVLGGLLQPGDVLTLVGAMGAGKTTFTQALATSLGIARPQRVCSPTFNICLVHEGPVPLVHIDLFRLGESAGLDDHSPAFGALGLEDLLERAAESTPISTRGGVVVIEWADLWAAETFERLEIRLQRPFGEADRRDIEVVPHGEPYSQRVEAWIAAAGADARPSA